MPKTKPHPDDDLIKREQDTTPGLIASSGEIQHNEYDDIDWTDLQKDYKKMLDGCPVISTTMKLMKYPLMSVGERFDIPKNATDRSKEAQEFLYFCKDKMINTYRYYKRHKLRALELGVSIHEKIIERGYKYKFIKNGIEKSKLTNRIIKLSPIQNDTIKGIYYDKIGEFDYLDLYKRIPEEADTEIIIEKEKLQIFTIDEYDNDIRGNSLLRPVRFYFDAGQNLLQSKVINAVKGTGIVGIHTKQRVTGSEKTKLEKLGRTLAAMTNGYYLIDTSRAEVIMNELKAQGDLLGVLEFINRMKFYNTMSQFIAAGLGQNGSRAATEAHKSPYELSANYIMSEYDSNEQKFWDYMLDISYLSDLSKEERPVFHSEPIKQSDMLKESQIYTNLATAGLILTEADKNIIREKLNLPVAEIQTQTTIQDEVEIQEKKEDVKMKRLSRKVSQEILDFERDVFEFDSANDHFLTTQDKVKKVIEESMHEYIQDITRQLTKDKYKNINIKPIILQKFQEKLDNIYEKSYNKGEVDVKKEAGKLKKTELSIDPKDGIFIKHSIGKLTKKLFFNVKTTVEIKMSKLSDSSILAKGGLKEYLLTFETGFKAEKNGIVKEVEHGYTNGRGNVLELMEKNVELYLYTATLDKNLCEVCAPLDGLIFTFAELTSHGLQLTAPVNPDCLGRDNDRCQIMIYKLKG